MMTTVGDIPTMAILTTANPGIGMDEGNGAPIIESGVPYSSINQVKKREKIDFCQRMSFFFDLC